MKILKKRNKLISIVFSNKFAEMTEASQVESKCISRKDV